MTELERQHLDHKARQQRIANAALSAQVPYRVPEHSSPQWEKMLEIKADVKWLSERVEALEAQAHVHKKLIEKFIALETDEKPKFGEIIDCVCEYYRVTRQDLLSARRTGDLVLPRMITCFLGRELTGMSYPQMGKRLGGRDHTTALHASNQIKSQIETDESLRDDIDVLKMKIGAKVIERRFGRNVVPLGA